MSCESEDDSKWGLVCEGLVDQGNDVPGDVPTHSCCSDGDDGKLSRRCCMRMKEEP